MKKSEKIEVRVSHEEKQRLSGIAETRGLSVSELIRDAVAEEIGTVPHVPRWPGYAAIAAGVLAAAALAVGLAKPSASGATLNTRAPIVSLYANTGGASHETALSRSANPFTMARENGQLIRVSATPGKSKDGITPVAFEVCAMVDDTCEATETFALSAVTDQHRASRRFDFGGDEVVVQVQAKSAQVKTQAAP